MRRWWRWRSLPEGHEKDDLGLLLLETTRDQVAPAYALGDFGKVWSPGEGIDRQAERRFLLRQLAASVGDLPGETAETGVYEGTTSAIVCRMLGRCHHGFDSFEGVSRPDGVDGDYWSAGDLSASEGRARRVLEPLGARIYRGWIPEVFDQAEVGELCFAHIDVDLYAPTRDSVAFFYPRLVPGGILLCDDYGFMTCPGARRAVDEFMADKPERIIEAPTGQGFIIKR